MAMAVVAKNSKGMVRGVHGAYFVGDWNPLLAELMAMCHGLLLAHRYLF